MNFLAASSKDPVDAVLVFPVFLTLARMASALDGGAVSGPFLLSESTAEVEVAGEGVWVGVHGDGGPTGTGVVEVGNLDSGVSEMTWVTSRDKHSSIC